MAVASDDTYDYVSSDDTPPKKGSSSATANVYTPPQNDNTYANANVYTPPQNDNTYAKKNVYVSPKKGITISKLVCIIIVMSVTLAFVALIIGLTLGLKKAYTPSEMEKYETCVDLSCKNFSILQSMFL